ncbi:hypothetical protein EVAR_67707_1 [Eumeta japonica]|uniref:Uncharacterized protein n=1 Tax=Eumeta variegata TaxID=151549 RepID=A0A4C2A0G9_EUMVA|nr:hypothetical protein EVAR_67707_1 [Eumeta japonica]
MKEHKETEVERQQFALLIEVLGGRVPQEYLFSWELTPARRGAAPAPAPGSEFASTIESGNFSALFRHHTKRGHFHFLVPFVIDTSPSWCQYPNESASLVPRSDHRDFQKNNLDGCEAITVHKIQPGDRQTDSGVLVRGTRFYPLVDEGRKSNPPGAGRARDTRERDWKSSARYWDGLIYFYDARTFFFLLYTSNDTAPAPPRAASACGLEAVIHRCYQCGDDRGVHRDSNMLCKAKKPYQFQDCFDYARYKDTYRRIETFFPHIALKEEHVVTPDVGIVYPFSTSYPATAPARYPEIYLVAESESDSREGATVGSIDLKDIKIDQHNSICATTPLAAEPPSRFSISRHLSNNRRRGREKAAGGVRTTRCPIYHVRSPV